MNEIIKIVHKTLLFDVLAEAKGVTADDSTGRILNQEIVATRFFTEGAKEYRISVNLRFDDQCKNGHETFAITGDFGEIRGDRYREISGGCIHDEIEQHFPELAHLIKWHLVSTDGPMHYLANTTYHASNRDCNGRLKGEPAQFTTSIKFDRVPITIKMDAEFTDWLEAALLFDAKTPTTRHSFKIVRVDYPKSDEPGSYNKFGPKYTFDSFPVDAWHRCPFDNIREAMEFKAAVESCKVEFAKTPTAWGEGKDRDFEAARSSAVWPEATDEQLSLPKAELEELLKARLPALLDAFKADMIACGFLWPESKGEQA